MSILIDATVGFGVVCVIGLLYRMRPVTLVSVFAMFMIFGMTTFSNYVAVELDTHSTPVVGHAFAPAHAFTIVKN